jgi:DNA-binding MarR family transcriptional regulator
MTRRRRYGPRSKSNNDQFMAISYAMAKSPAWRSLSPAAIKVWVELHTRFHGANNGKLHLSLDEGARLLGMGKATISRAFDELIEKGFVELTRRGHWYGRKASEYALTHKAHDGHPPKYTYKRWTPPNED